MKAVNTSPWPTKALRTFQHPGHVASTVLVPDTRLGAAHNSPGTLYCDEQARELGTPDGIPENPNPLYIKLAGKDTQIRLKIRVTFLPPESLW